MASLALRAVAVTSMSCVPRRGETSSVSRASRFIGFSATADSTRDYNQVRTLVLNEVQKLFKPEFINRLDDLIVFHKLEPKQVRQIAELMLDNLGKRLQENNITLKISNKVKDRLAKDGFSEMYGARPLRRLIEDQIENAISMKIINGELDHGETISVDLLKGEFSFKKSS